MEQMKKHGNRIITFILILFLGFLIYSGKLFIENNDIHEKMRFQGEDKVKLRLKYTGYAKGDDFPNYCIDSVISFENKSKEFYINKNINLKYDDKLIKEKLTLPNCSTNCFSLIVIGNFELNRYGMLRVSVEDGYIKQGKKCCH